MNGKANLNTSRKERRQEKIRSKTSKKRVASTHNNGIRIDKPKSNSKKKILYTGFKQ
jgi:hypothetical protein